MKTNWQTKKLGEICTIIKGKNPELFKEQLDEMLPYLGAKFMRGTKDAEFASVRDKKSVLVSEKDLIIICDGSKSGDIFSGFKGILSSTMGKMDFNENELDSIYLKSFLDLNFELFNGSKKGAAIPHLDFAVFKNLEIPLPPLATQHQIVTILDEKFAKLREVKRLRQEAIGDTEKILAATLREIFEEGKEKFEMTNLGDVAKLVRGPFGGSLKKEIFVPEGIAVYEQGNVIDNILDDFRYFVTDEKFEEMKRFEVFAGDILMSCSGTIGKFIIIPDKFTKGIINQALLKITPEKNITVDYLKYALQDYLTQSTTHIKGGAIKNIASVKELKQFSIPLPPLAEQQKIVTRLDALSEKLRTLRELQQSQLEDMKKLVKAYLREAFRGELC